MLEARGEAYDALSKDYDKLLVDYEALADLTQLATDAPSAER
jgi:hypothetical protein